MTSPRAALSSKPVKILTLLALFTLPSTAWGQDAADKLNRPTPSPQADPWSVQWAASVEQAFQVDRDQLVDLDSSDIQDEGEYAVGAAFKADFPRYAAFSLSPLVAINPYLFDEQDEASAWSITARVQRKFVLPQGRTLAGESEAHSGILPYASYRYGQSFEGVFDVGKADDQELALGAVFTGVLCAGAKSLTGECGGGTHSEYTVTVSYLELDSSDDDDDRHGPKVDIKWEMPAFSGTAVWIDASADFRTFDSLPADSGSRVAEAERYVLGAGLDVSGWARRTLGVPTDVDVKIGARWVRVLANRAALERDEFAIVPTLAWEH